MPILDLLEGSDMRKIIYLLLFTHFIHAEISWSPIEELAHPGVIYHVTFFCLHTLA